MSKVIEIVVIGGVGSGKSHVLDVIDRALRGEYGHHVQIASHDLSCERGLGNPGAKPRVSETIFSLREQGAASGGGSSDSVGAEYWKRQLSSGTVSVEAVQGCATDYVIDPLESAIRDTVSMLRDERESLTGQQGIKTVVCLRLEKHLEDLLSIQFGRLSQASE